MKKTIFLAAAAIILAASCTKSVSYEPATEIALAPYNYSPTKVQYGPVDGTAYNTNEDFGVFAQHTTSDAGTTFSQDNGTLSKYLDNVVFTKKSTTNTWEGRDANYYWPRTGSLYFAGYSPAGAKLTSVAYDFNTSTPKMTITGFEQLGYAYTDGTSTPAGYYMVDLMWFDATSTSEKSGAPSVVFNHALSYLTFNFTAFDNNLFTIESVVLKTIAPTGDFVSNTKVWSNFGTSKDIQLYNTSVALTKSTAFKIDDVLVIPQATQKLVVTYTQKAAANQNAITQVAVLSLTGGDSSASTDNNWLIGYHYTYNIQFTADEILLTPSVTDWATHEVSKPVTVNN